MDVIFILVQPNTSGNIGSVARAIKNMGFKYIRIVYPPNIDWDEVKKMAHGALDILDNIQMYDELEKAIADIDITIGTAFKPRKPFVDLIPSNELKNILQNKPQLIRHVGLLFGREKTGLHQLEIQKCNLISYIPTSPLQPSLNLSHAVLIYAYELSQLHTASLTHTNEFELKALINKLSPVLLQLNLHTDHLIHKRIVERIFQASETDIHLIYSVLDLLKKKYPPDFEE